MSFNPNFTPATVAEFEKKWEHATLPSDGHIGPDDAARLMIVFQAMSDEFGDLVASALYYEETVKASNTEARNKAFRNSDAKSDRQREADALVDETYLFTEKLYTKAKAVRRYLEAKHESAIRSHHAMKSLLRDRQDEKWTL